MENQIEKAGHGITRQGFGTNEIQTTGSTVADILATRAKAEVEARFIVAMRNPRDWDEVRQKLMKSCKRPSFAGSATEKVWGGAWYKKPGYDGAEGFSVRFAEEAIRSMGNMDARSSIIWEDDAKRMISVEVIDLESNVSIPTTIVIEKTVERKNLKSGETMIGSRRNSNGETVYIRAATEDEVFQKQNVAISKAMRNGIMRMVPGDIQSECRDEIKRTQRNEAAKDPDAYRKTITDAFAALGVTAVMIRKFLGKNLSDCSTDELSDLRELGIAIKDKQTTWTEATTVKVSDEETDDKPKPRTTQEAVERAKAADVIKEEMQRTIDAAKKEAK